MNATLPGRAYRIALINFSGDEGTESPMPRIVRGRPGVMMGMAMAAAPAAAPEPAPVERSEKITLNARIVFATLPEGHGTAVPASPPPAPAPAH